MQISLYASHSIDLVINVTFCRLIEIKSTPHDCFKYQFKQKILGVCGFEIDVNLGMEDCYAL